MTILDSIRRVLAEDAAHPDLTHEVFLTGKTYALLMKDANPSVWSAPDDRAITHLLGCKFFIQDVARDTIVTYRAGRAISSTYL